ncbi:type II secretion system F family protein [Flavimaricola marinus]|uniref:Bacterial type II secretion system protein F domain protein n=1 Tax=Flavimaricola marinus TaxID=1819565 RepID=A0A238L971_9RHOB|nr:type II secretion system F family protein [Flavimaricola marinus]SMY06123.1 Bacterial type II secretion system protein F domain protein [Flavimaricola marinus]
MLNSIETLAQSYGLSTQVLLLAGIAGGSLLLFVGVASMLTHRDPASVRLAATHEARKRSRKDRGILKTPAEEAKGIMKSFLPKDLAQRTKLHRELAQAGRTGPHALRNFTLVRIVLGLVLPLWLLLIVFASQNFGFLFPERFVTWVAGYSSMSIFQSLSILVAIGYWLPLIWLRSRVSERKQRITESFPNALDLMQISVEAGLGFDIAMTRVGNELAEIAPDIAFEFLTVQQQVQAGRPRQNAMRDMAEKTGVDVVNSFANVVHQSIHFGTSMSEALTTYAAEMRLYRELKAQEMANKLPVKLSGVMAALMLPALIIITVGPVVIRYSNM